MRLEVLAILGPTRAELADALRRLLKAGIRHINRGNGKELETGQPNGVNTPDASRVEFRLIEILSIQMRFRELCF
jgi:hypothetical protein